MTTKIKRLPEWPSSGCRYPTQYLAVLPVSLRIPMTRSQETAKAITAAAGIWIHIGTLIALIRATPGPVKK